MLIKVNLDNVDYNVVYSPVNNKVDVKLYKPLVRELWKIATQHEKEKLIIIINETKTIFFNNVLNLFKFTGQNTTNYSKLKNISPRTDIELDKLSKYKNYGDCSCVCGTCIVHEYIVTHTKTNDFYIIGSECIHWWNNTELNKRLLNTHEIIKAESEGIEPPIFCSFCQSKRACKMCINKGFINNIFQKWKKYAKDKISNVISIMRSKVKFGKYNGKQYIKLCRDSSYVKYIMDSNFEYKIKKILSDHHKYKTIINKYTFL